MRTRLLVPALLSAALATSAINAQTPAKPAQAKHDSTKSATHAKTATATTAATTKAAPATTHQMAKPKADSAKPTASHLPTHKKPPM